jgi:type IV pilus assembly protein PilA
MNAPKITEEERRISMKNEQGFSLIELLIVVAIIAVIAAIAVPSLLQAKMAANEAGAIQGCRTLGSSEVAYAAVNNSTYSLLADLQTGGFIDARFTDGVNGYNGYTYADGVVMASAGVPADFGILATPIAGSGTGRYIYGISVDQVVRYEGEANGAAPAKCGAGDCQVDDPIGYTGR